MKWGRVGGVMRNTLWIGQGSADGDGDVTWGEWDRPGWVEIVLGLGGGVGLYGAMWGDGWWWWRGGLPRMHAHNIYTYLRVYPKPMFK